MGDNLIAWMGGKARQANKIISYFPENYEDMTYVEVFGGGGWVLYKKKPSKIEVYNDINGDLVNLFKVIRDNKEELQEWFDYLLYSRQIRKEFFEKYRAGKWKDDVERAGMFLYLILSGFAHKPYNPGFAYGKTGKNNAKTFWNFVDKRIDEIHARLKNVTIENLEFEDCIKRYDSKHTLFYLDPPYIGNSWKGGNKEYYGGDGWDNEEEHRRLAGVLKNIRGKFALSYFDHELIRELYPEEEGSDGCALREQ